MISRNQITKRFLVPKELEFILRAMGNTGRVLSKKLLTKGVRPDNK